MESHTLYKRGYLVDHSLRPTQQQQQQERQQKGYVQEDLNLQQNLQQSSNQQLQAQYTINSTYPPYTSSPSQVAYGQNVSPTLQPGRFANFSFTPANLDGGSSRVGMSNRTLSSFSRHQQSLSVSSSQMDASSPPLRQTFSDPSSPDGDHRNGTFSNPWTPSSPTQLLHSSSSASSLQQITGRTNSHDYQPSLSNVRHTPRKSFTSTLSTTFEGMELDRLPKQQQQIIPPLRIDPPPPSTLNAQLRPPPRRQSVAAGYFVSHRRRDEGRTASSTSTSPLERLPDAAYESLEQHQPERQQSPVMFTVPAPKFNRLSGRADLRPHVNARPKYRRASSSNSFVSPLNALTGSLTITYSMCVPEFDYKTSKNPRRVLTKPSQPKTNNGYDNEQSDYILYVNDILGVQENRKYMVVDILGHGTFGQVVKCQNLDTQEIVAVKVVKSRPVYLNQSLTEAGILEYLNSKVDPDDEHHLLRMKDKFMHKNHLCLVFELLSSNLYELVRQNQFHGLTIKLIRKFTIQMLDALCVLKDAELIHCDLKPENVLLVTLDRPDIKVIDFGSACHEKQVAYTYIQSRFYRSPEVILGLSYSSAVDMWSLGCIIAELFLGLPLFPGTSEFNQLTRIVRMLGMPPSWMIDMGKNSLNLINRRVDQATGKKLYGLKSAEQYSRECHTKEQPGKEYFKDRYLEDIIMNYRMPTRSIAKPTIDKELENRKCLIHFLRGILNLNPLERWTPQEASMHPFVTSQPFMGDWNPPAKNFIATESGHGV
ncbi:DEKNAAC102786 [Brettanomyces naardenensis]|uniref:DEKNAAC102786 n=1 Tax=Brettanomyces naardenensis TaxID=13370 RepID=A0A448YK98_BRENA|nr:DEKNAAC102786 [Brettanomyces naardenensis]